MRLFIDKHYFISVLPQANVFDCQVMELIHGMGYYPASIEDDQEDVVSAIVHNTFSEESLVTTSLEEVFKFHKQLLLELSLEQIS